MYIINKVVEDYEGTWSNALMYEHDLDKAIEIIDELQKNIVSLKQKYIEINKIINLELKKAFPYYGDYKLEFEEQFKNIDANDTEHYFDKEQRRIKELTEQQLNDKEMFLYQRSYMNYACILMYFEVQKIKNSSEAFATQITEGSESSIVYSTKDNAKQYADLFGKSRID